MRAPSAPRPHRTDPSSSGEGRISCYPRLYFSVVNFVGEPSQPKKGRERALGHLGNGSLCKPGPTAPQDQPTEGECSALGTDVGVLFVLEHPGKTGKPGSRVEDPHLNTQSKIIRLCVSKYGPCLDSFLLVFV